MAVRRVDVIKAAIVLAAAISTAVIVFVTSYRIFGFGLVSRGRSLDVTITWAMVIWLALPSVIVALFVRRWWLKQSERDGTDRSSTLPWVAGYLVTTLAALFYYFLTFTALLTP